MEAVPPLQPYLEAALEAFGIEADEVERAVMAGVWSVYEPGMELLRTADLDGGEHELRADLSRPPER
jgi:hypothetical protein